MNSEDLINMFGLVGDQQLVVTLRSLDGQAYAQSVPCSVRQPILPDPSEFPVICIVPDGDQGFYTNFPVENVDKQSGSTLLSGPLGTAQFNVVSK